MMARIEALIKSSQQRAARPEVQRGCADVALLIARIALAWIFIYHGAGTLFAAFGGLGIHGMSIYFASTAHLHPGTFFAVLSGITEFFGGIAVGVGVLGRFAAIGLFGDMVIAMITVTFKNGLESSAAGSRIRDQHRARSARRDSRAPWNWTYRCRFSYSKSRVEHTSRASSGRELARWLGPHRSMRSNS